MLMRRDISVSSGSMFYSKARIDLMHRAFHSLIRYSMLKGSVKYWVSGKDTVSIGKVSSAGS